MDTEALQELLDENLDQVEAALYGIGWRIIPRTDPEWRIVKCQRVCQVCGKQFQTDRPNRAAKFCSIECSAKVPRDRRGRKAKERVTTWREIRDARTA
jgi:hypothetical protein